MFRKIQLFVSFVLVTSFASASVHIPIFSGGHSQALGVCENSGAVSINALMSVIDSATGVTDTWSIIADPLHGIAAASYTTTAAGGLLTPSGLSYSPAVGYIGSDSFKVRVSNSFGADTTTVHVTVNPLPSAIYGTMHMCPGFTTSITDTTVGGTWGSSDIAVATVGLGTGIVTGHSSGTANITYTIYASGCSTVATVTVDAAPGGIGGHLSVCKGLTNTLIDTPLGGRWTSFDTSIASVDTFTGVYFGNALGTTTITYTLPDGCLTTTIVSVQVSPTPIDGDLMLCAGSGTNLSDALPGGTWTSSDITIATIDSVGGLVSAISGGTAVITYATPACFVSALLTVNPLPSPITGGLVVHIGNTTSLADLTSGGTWSGSDPSVASVDGVGLVTGLAAGTTAITYALGSGCIAAVIVSVVSTPTPIGGLLRVCQGTTTALTDATPGGFWYSSHPSVAVVDSVTGIVSGVSIGTAYITYAIGTSLTASIVTVNSNPAAITGTLSVCQGQSTSLSDASAGGSWSSSDATVAEIGSGSGIYTGISAGSATITYTVSTSCFTTQAVTIIPSPAAISGTALICLGLTTSLSDLLAGGTWLSANTAIATIGSASGLVSAISSGTSTIDYTSAGGCIASVVVTVNPPASAGVIIGASSVCSDSVISLTSTAPGGTWSSVSGLASVSASGLVTGISLGVDTILYTVTNFCGAASSIHVVTILNCIGDAVPVTGVASYSFRVYPNPASTVLYIDAPENVTYALLAMDGHTVLHGLLIGQIDISQIPGGMYFVQLFDESDRLLCTKKIIKER